MFVNRLKAYISLTKPSILLLVIITGATALFIEGSLNDSPFLFFIVMLFLALSGGSANGFNQYFERDRDSMMERTKRRRALPMEKIHPTEAFVFSLVIGVVSVIGFWMMFNWLSAVYTLGTILFYSIFYTLYLKPRTHWNIVIGGAAGAMAPVIAWAAATGGNGIVPWLMFSIIFLWTPPHFWALAVCLKEDYRKVGLPMLPLLIGDHETWKRIMRYTIWTLLFSLGLSFFGLGVVYVVSALVLGAIFINKVRLAQREQTQKAAWGVFSYSIIYLLLLFTIMMIDKGVS